MDGLRKANSDAMLNSLGRITNLLHISDEGKRAKAEADIAQSKADQLANDEDDNVTINFIRTNRSEPHDDD